MSYVEQIQGLEVVAERVWDEHAVAGNFTEAIAGFRTLLDRADVMPHEEEELQTPLTVLTAGVLRRRGMAFLGRALQLRNAANGDVQKDVADAHEDLADAYDLTVENVGRILGEDVADHRRLVAAHGLTLAGLARFHAAKQLYRPFHNGRLVDCADTKNTLGVFNAADMFLAGSNAGAATVNRMDQAIFVYATGGNQHFRTSLLKSAGFVLSSVLAEDDPESADRARHMLRQSGEHMETRRSAISYLTSWGTL